MIKIMKNLDNKGLTAIEILVCFSIVVVIVMSMFKVVNNQKDKQTIESYKNSITTYKNSVTKTIEEDIRTGGGIRSVDSINDETDQIEIIFGLSDGNTRIIQIQKKIECDEDSEDEDKVINCDAANRIIYYYGNYYGNAVSRDVFTIPDIYNLKFNKVDVANNDGYLKIYVGFDHPDLGKKYSAFELIDPIDSIYF